jgi:O-antigen/teichoic acid export membrane protein
MAVRPCLFLLLIYLASLTSSELTADRAMMLQLFAVLMVMLVQYIAMRSKLSHVLDAAPKTQGNKIWTRTAIPLLITTLFVQYFPELSVVLLGMLLPAKDVAIFYTCFRIALFIGFGIAAINALLTPNISRLYSGGEIKKLQHEVSRTTLVKFSGSVLALFILIFFGDTVLGWFGEDFIEGYSTLLLLASAQVLISAVGPVDLLLNLTGHQDRCMITFSTALPVAIGLNLLLVPKLGILGAGIAILITVVFWNMRLYRLTVKELDIRPSVLSAIRLYTR